MSYPPGLSAREARSMCGSSDIDDPVSDCCGAPMDDWPDCDICPKCKEHTEPYRRSMEDQF